MSALFVRVDLANRSARARCMRPQRGTNAGGYLMARFDGKPGFGGLGFSGSPVPPALRTTVFFAVVLGTAVVLRAAVWHE
jgi:hypothetical protein